MNRSTLSLFTLTLLSGAAGAQSILHTVNGPTASGYAGSSVAGLGDINGDGKADFAMGIPFESSVGFNAGRVQILSGANGAVLYDFLGAHAGDWFGWSVAGVGDVNNDGRPDFAIGAPVELQSGANRPGSVRVYSGFNGSILHTFWGDSNGDLFGQAVAGGFDADADSYADLVVGAPGDDNNAKADSGSVRAFSGRTGGIFTTWNGLSAGDQYGAALAMIGDASADGQPDIAVGAPLALLGGIRPGMARVIGSVTGATLLTVWGNQDNEQFGTAVAGGLDVEADGFADLIVGAPKDDFVIDDGGSVSVFNTLDGQLYNTFYGDHMWAHAGQTVASIGDWNGDGTGDFAYGQPTQSASSTGSVIVRSGWTGAKLLQFSGLGAFDQFGCAIADGHDVNGDGGPDMVIGARYVDPTGKTDAGQVTVVSSKWLPAHVYCTAKVNSQGCTPYLTVAGLPSISNTQVGFSIMAWNVLNKKSGIMLYGFAPAATPFNGGTLCVQGPLKRSKVYNSGGSSIGTDCTGSLGFDFNATLQSGTVVELYAGRTVYAQWWYRDPASVGSTGLSNAASFAVAP